MAACVTCGTAVEGRFCGVCGTQQPDTSSSTLRRAATAKGLAYRVEAEVPSESVVTLDPDDVFVGIVDGRAAFVLVGARRVVPERCRGVFLSRSPHAHSFDVSVGRLGDGRGASSDVSLRGTIVVQIVDALTFIDADVPVSASALGDAMADLVAPELERRLAGQLRTGEITMSELSDGLSDETLRTMLGDVVAGLALPSTHGVIVGFEDVALNGGGAPRSTATSEDTDVMPALDTVLARAHEDEPVETIPTASPVGSGVVVAEADVFLGVRAGSVTVQLGPGRHTLQEPIELGVFVRTRPQSERFVVDLGLLQDADGVRGNGRARGTFKLLITDAAELIGAEGPNVTGAELVDRARTSLGSLLRERLASALADGRARLDALEQTCKRLAEVVEHAPLPGVSVSIDDLSIDGAFEGPTRAAESRVAADSSNGDLVGAQVLVAWSDGNAYPGMVSEIQQGHCLVHFPNGRSEWVPLSHVSRA